MKSLEILFCVILVVNCHIVNCDDVEIIHEPLGNYPSEKSIVKSLNQTVVVVLDSEKKDKSQFLIVQYPHNKANVTDISKYFAGHVLDFTVQPQKQLGIFTEKNMTHIIVLHDSSTVLPERFKLDFVPSEISFPDNNNNGKFFIIFDQANRQIHYTLNGGQTIIMLTDNVRSFVWQYDDGKNFLLVERRTSPEDPSSSLEYIELTPLHNIELELITLADQVRDFSVKRHFVFIHRANDTLLYYKRQGFICTRYYPVFEIHNVHLVDVEKNSIKVIVENDQESRFYIGNYYVNSREIRFELSLLNIERDYLTKIESAPGVYIATLNSHSKISKSVITFDNGRTWNTTEISVSNNKMFSSKLVPGVIAVKIGENFTFSQNGGKSWHNPINLKHNYNFEFNNMLGIIIGTDLVKETNDLVYSTTCGIDFLSQKIYKKLLKNQVVYSKEYTTAFYILARDMEHNNFLTQIDFKAMFTMPCTDSNYIAFTTDVCLLGQKVTYQRRANSCLPDKKTIAKQQTCSCNFADYDCDTNFGRTNFSLPCKPEPGIKITSPEKCPLGEFYIKTKGYQKIESSLCMDDSKSEYTAEIAVCPYPKLDYLLVKTGNTLKLYDEENHEIKSINDPRESCEFDLLKSMMFDVSNRKVVIQHTLNKNSHGKILAQERIAIHNLNYDWISGWLFYITKIPVTTIKAFPVSSDKSTPIKLINFGSFTQITSLTVHTVHKYLYWRDGNHFNRASLKYINNITGIKVDTIYIPLFKNQILGSDLVIDYVADRLYFYDSTDGFIKNCDLLGEACYNTLKVYSDSIDLTPTNIYQIAISHKYLYFYNPNQKTLHYWNRPKEFTDLVSNRQELFKHDFHDFTELKYVSKSMQLYTKCLGQHNKSMCLDFLSLNQTTNRILENPMLKEMVCPDSKYCDGVFDCFYGEDEEYCVKGGEEVVKIGHHKFVWIGIVIALGIISFIIASVMLYKRAPARFTGAQYNVLENRVLFNEEILEDDESDIEPLFH